MQWTLNIPVDSFQRKILIKKLGDTYKLSKHDHHGNLLISYLSNKSKAEPCKKSDLFYTVIFPERFNKYHYYKIITEEAAKKFVQYFVDRFYEEMFVFIDSRLRIRADFKKLGYKKSNLEVKQIIEEFMQFYNISEEDKKYETLYKTYVRKFAGLKPRPCKEFKDSSTQMSA